MSTAGSEASSRALTWLETWYVPLATTAELSGLGSPARGPSALVLGLSRDSAVTSTPSTVVSRLPGWTTRDGAGARVVGDRVGIRPLDDRHVAGADQRGLVVVRDDPGVAAERGGQRERCLVGDPERPRRLQHGLAERGGAGADAVQQVSQRVHARSVDEYKGNQAQQTWVVSLLAASLNATFHEPGG